MVSSEWGAPNTYEPGFNLDDVKAGKYGSRLHFWDLEERRVAQTIDLGDGRADPARGPLPPRPGRRPRLRRRGAVQHDVALPQRQRRLEGREGDRGRRVEHEGWPFPVPGLITDLVVSMDDRFLYFSNWLHGDLRQYDITDPAKPKLTGQVWLGGVLGKPDRRAAASCTAARRCSSSGSTATAVRHQLALLDLGQPVLPRA